MTENKTSIPRAETQKERWMKYGANVALVCVVAVLLAGAVTWLAQIRNKRVDTTRSGLYSLKPQTINLIKDNTQSIKIVSLYTRPRADAGDDSTERVGTEGPTVDYAQPVADLLEEYHRKGSKIDVEVIDPIDQPTKVDQLIEEVTRKYGGEIAKYKAVVDDYLPPRGPDGKPKPTDGRKPSIFEDIITRAKNEMKKVAAVFPKEQKDDELTQTMFYAAVTVQGFPQHFEKVQGSIEKRLKLKPPDYKGAVDGIDEGMSLFSQMLAKVIEDFKKCKDDTKVPQEIRAYMTESLPRYEELKKIADDLSNRIKGLGELKLDSLRQSLKARNAILVMGENDIKVLPAEKVWQVPDEIRGFTSEGKPKPRFAGEQQVSSAILSLTAKTKPKVCFVRPGGVPLTNSGIPGFQAGGPFSLIAERLRDYNFEVMEKDLSGMYAMQAQMQGQPAAPEPTDDQIKDAVWVVLDLPAGRSPMGPPPSIAEKVKAHLAAGGSALVLPVPRADNLGSILDDWGVKMRTDAVIVHESVKNAAGRTGDYVEEAQLRQMIFVLKEYGDHPLARPLASLDSVLWGMVPVETQQKKGYKSAPLLPIPTSLKTWGTINVDAVLRDEKVEYKPPKGATLDGDIAPPLYGGSAVEKEGAGRLVVIGCVQLILDDILNAPDPTLARQNIRVSRFPGNGELFMNSVFWLTKMDTMIAISPAAMEVSRIGEMSSGVQNAWRVGLVLIGLPLLAIVAGIMVYAARRD